MNTKSQLAGLVTVRKQKPSPALTNGTGSQETTASAGNCPCRWDALNRAIREGPGSTHMVFSSVFRASVLSGRAVGQMGPQWCENRGVSLSPDVLMEERLLSGPWLSARALETKPQGQKLQTSILVCPWGAEHSHNSEIGMQKRENGFVLRPEYKTYQSVGVWKL